MPGAPFVSPDVSTSSTPAASSALLMAAMTSSAPRDPREFRPEVPAGGAACILQCLRQAPGARFQTLAALRKAWGTSEE